MRKWVAAGVLAAGMLLASCAAEPQAAETEDPVTPSPIATTTPTPTPTVEAVAVPQGCVDYVPAIAPGSETLQAIALTAVLPEGVVLNPGMQVLESADEPGKIEAVARVCSDGLTRDELIEAGNAIATAIYADPAHETLTVLKVSSWIPSGEFLDTDPDVDTISTDYELFLWDAAGRSRDSNWN